MGRPTRSAALERLYGPRSESIDRANAEVLRRLDEGAPMLVDIQTAGDVIPRLAGRTLLHCGPAIEWDAVCDPLRRSMRAATVAEGWATDVEHADRLLADGDVQLAPATDHATVVPMATAMGPSTPVFVVDNRGGRHPGLRADQSGAGGDRVVRTRNRCRYRAAGVSA